MYRHFIEHEARLIDDGVFQRKRNMPQSVRFSLVISVILSFSIKSHFISVQQLVTLPFLKTKQSFFFPSQ